MSQAKRKKLSDSADEDNADATISQMAEQISLLSSRIWALESTGPNGAGKQPSKSLGPSEIRLPVTVWQVILVHHWILDLQYNGLYNSEFAVLKSPETRIIGLYLTREDAGKRVKSMRDAALRAGKRECSEIWFAEGEPSNRIYDPPHSTNECETIFGKIYLQWAMENDPDNLENTKHYHIRESHKVACHVARLQIKDVENGDEDSRDGWESDLVTESGEEERSSPALQLGHSSLQISRLPSTTNKKTRLSG